MTLIKYILFAAALLPVHLSAQSITVQLQLNPLHIGQYIPASLGVGVEVGLSPKSSIQINGLYRIDNDLGNVFTKGPKVYLAYRYYLNLQGQKNRGYYVSSFLGYESLQSYDYESLSSSPDQLINEKLAGVLLGFQPYKSNRFTVDIYGGPEYQWRAIKNTHAALPIQESNSDRLWLRAGFYFCYRIKR